MTYARFAAMIGVSTLLMYGLMFLNTYAVDHIEFSQTRMWMAVLMGAVMALIMIGFMWKMYENIRLNVAIIAGSVILFGISLAMVRSQATVDDLSYVKAMIPHHSIAIMTSERAHIKDPEVRRLADGIIDAQVREIVEMKRIVARLERHSTPAAAADIPSYRERGVAPPPPQTDQSAGIDTLEMARSGY